MFNAFGMPVVPDEKRRAAVVVSLILLLSKRCHSAVPWVWSQDHDRTSLRIEFFGGWMSKMNMFERGIDVSFAAMRILGSKSGSTMKYFIFAVRIA
jgi:hypothetical protein